MGIESLSLVDDGNRQVLEGGTVVEHGQFIVTYTDGSVGIGADVEFDYMTANQDSSSVL